MVMLTGAAGCGSTGIGGGDNPGFLSDYSSLGPAQPGMAWFGDDPDLGAYEGFVILNTRVFLHDEAPGHGTGLRELIGFTNARLRVALEGGYRVENVANDGIAMIRVALTNLSDDSPALDDVDDAVVSGAGLTGLAIEGEVLDPATRRPVAVIIEPIAEVKLTAGGLSHRGNAETAINAFAERLRRAIDKAHGR